MTEININDWTFDYSFSKIDGSIIVHADCFELLSQIPSNSIHAIVTDPPYGVKEYDFDQLQKLEDGNGGIWRIPPSFDGNERSPLPRFTALSKKERARLERFFTEWSKVVLRILKPGAHVFLASNAYLAQLVFSAVVKGGLEFRGEIIRQVRTLRGGDRPKNAEEQYNDVSSLPRGCYEPWGLFRKPLPANFTVSDCLEKYKTGGLRRKADGNPFEDVIKSGRTPKNEKAIAPHPSLKPQEFLRQIVFASLPLGQGLILDPFMGAGSTVAAANALGLSSFGIERHFAYYRMAEKAIPKLTSLRQVGPELYLF